MAISVGRILGTLAALAAVALWGVFLFRNPYAEPAVGRVFLFGSLMMLASVLAAVASARGAHLAMYLLFLLLFFPVGLYVLLGAGVFSAIGWSNLVYLLAAALVHRGVRAQEKKGGDLRASASDLRP